MLHFRYGSYRHEEADVTISSFGSAVQWTARGQPQLVRKSMAISGVIFADTVSALTDKLRALETAYAKQYQNAGLYDETGTATAHVLTTGNSLGGVRSSGVTYPTGDGAEYTTYRSYSVTLEADYFVNGVTILDFNETLTFNGTCGPRKIIIECLTGEAVEQTVNQKTKMTATQSGSSIGWLSMPSPPQPLWPGNEIVESRSITNGSAKWVNGQRVEFPISWSYSFQSTTPLTGTPHNS